MRALLLKEPIVAMAFIFFYIMPKYKIDMQDRILHEGVWLYRIVATRDIRPSYYAPSSRERGAVMLKTSTIFHTEGDVGFTTTQKYTVMLV